MRILRPIVEAATDLMPIGCANFFHHRGIRTKPVGDDLLRSAVLLHDPLEKFQRRSLVPPRGDHRLQDFAFMVDGAPKIAELAVDLHKRLVQVPAPLRMGAHVRDASLTDLGGEHRAKPVPPEPDGLVADVDPALGQEIFDVSKRQRVSHVHHHDQTDDLRRAVEISERIAHGLKLPRRDALRALCLTTPIALGTARCDPELPLLRPGGRDTTTAAPETIRMERSSRRTVSLAFPQSEEKIVDKEHVKGAADRRRALSRTRSARSRATRRCRWKAKSTRQRAPRMRPSATSRTPHVKRTNANLDAPFEGRLRAALFVPP